MTIRNPDSAADTRQPSNGIPSLTARPLDSKAVLHHLHAIEVKDSRMHIRMKKIVGGKKALGGAVEGRRDLAKLLEAAGPEPAAPEPLFVDFDGIELATASYQRETIVALQGVIRARRSNHYLVVANANPAVREDLEVLARADGLAFLACMLDGADKVSKAGLIGTLDPKAEATFDLVCERGETDARELMQANAGRDDVGHTAWNNRLAGLVQLGLIAEYAVGKVKRYRPVLGGKIHGS
jgi:hypothetical protein